MRPESNDGVKRIEKYLLENATPEDKSIPNKNENKEKPAPEKPEWADKKNDDSNTYEYSDNPDEDDKNW